MRGNASSIGAHDDVRLTELHAELVGMVAEGMLLLDCPFPTCTHSLRIPISAEAFHEREPRSNSDYPRGKNGKVKVWQASGEFPETLTVTPSIHIAETDDQGNVIRTICWHGWIREGNAE